MKCKLFDTNKKGTIIFSHCRSSGTQLKLIVRNVMIDFKCEQKIPNHVEF
jgi:HSP90 family molecular chaperone